MTVLRDRHRFRHATGFIPTAYAGIVGVLAAITVADLLVDYLKFEPRIWFLVILMILAKMEWLEDSETPGDRVKANTVLRNLGRKATFDGTRVG